MSLIFVWSVNRYWNKVTILSIYPTHWRSSFLICFIWSYISPLPSVFTHTFWLMRRQHGGVYYTILCMQITQGYYTSIVWNNIRCIHRSRSEIWTQRSLMWWNSWIKMMWHVLMRMWCHSWINICCHDCIIMIRMILV